MGERGREKKREEEIERGRKIKEVRGIEGR